MATSENNEIEQYEEGTLLDLAGYEAPAPPAAKVKDLAPRTPEEDSAGDLIAAWIRWYRDCTGSPIPSSVIARLGKQVKELILAGYSSNQIKYGLGVWAVEQYDNPRLPPQALDQYVWHIARESSPKAREAQARMKNEVHNFHRITSTTSPLQSTKKQTRERNTDASIDEWLSEKQQENQR